MKVCLVYADIGGTEHYGAHKYYHGVGYLSSVLKKAGHATALIYLEHEPVREEFLAQVAALRPDLLAFSATTHQQPYVDRCAHWVKESVPDLLAVVGGPHPTLAPESVLANPDIDAICVGEGEYALLDLVTAVEAGGDWTVIPNLWLRRNGHYIRNPLRSLITNLDELPFPDRELFDYPRLLEANGGWVEMLAGRGCPYGCSYCCNPGLQERYKGLGPYVRFRSVENILAEIRVLSQQYPIRTLNFQDDTFTLNREWTLAFCAAYGQEFRYPFWINTRVERITDELVVSALARAGCRGVRIGLESGNEDLRSQVLKRRMSNDQIRQAFALARKHGLDVYTCNMLGIPGETAAMIEETIGLNRELEPAGLQFSVFYPYPMTELHEQCVRQNLILDDRALHSYYERRSILNLPTLTSAELEHAYDRFQELKVELQMKKSSPRQYRLYRALRGLLGGNGARARSIMRRADRALRLVVGSPSPSTQAGKE